MARGPKGEKRAADLNRRAFDIVRIASGESEEPMGCSDYQDHALMGLRCERLQLDEIWSFVGKKPATSRATIATRAWAILGRGRLSTPKRS
jgi:hypothetical protein